MSFDWPEFQLSEKCTIKSSTRIFKKEYVETGIPFMRSKDVIDKALGVFSHFELFISKERYQEIKCKYGSPNEGDLLISSVGNRSGWPYIVQDEGDFYFKDGNVIWMSEFDGLDPDFLAYWLKSDIGQSVLASIMIGSAQKAITIDSLRKLWVSFPPFEYQQLSSDVLKLLDKKIASNKAINQTLEEMAQAIFQSWFVDFDPVKSKMNGEQPEGMDEATASLFPEKLVESELGLIPEGWEASSMGEHFNVTMGQSPKGETYNEDGEGIAFFQGRRDFGFRYPDVRVFTTDPKRYAKAGDTLISVRAPVGDKNMAAIDCCIGRGVGAIKHKSDSRSFTYAFVSHIEKKLGDSGSSGTVFSSINQKELKKVSFVAPPQELVEAFHNLVDPIDQKVEVLSKEIDSLSQLRDTLLPKLLSGEIELAPQGGQ